MNVVCPARITRIAKENITDKTVIQAVSKRPSIYFSDFINNMVEEILKEAMNGNFYKMASIDIKRGIDKWLKKQITEVKEDMLI